MKRGALRGLVSTLLVATSACSSPQTPTPVVNVPAAPSAPSAVPVAPAVASRPWGPAWQRVAVLDDAETVFETLEGLCATTKIGVRCEAGTQLGPLATAHITSPTKVWGFAFVCGVGDSAAFVCSHPPSDSATKGPPKLADVTSATVHSATHRDGSLSVTANRDFVGYADPRWSKVSAVTDAVAVASSWYATSSCYLRKNGEAACVDHDVAATPTPLAGVTDGARIWQTEHAIWVLTKGGRLLATKSRRTPLREVATQVIDFAPLTVSLAGGSEDTKTLPSQRPDVPAAVLANGQLVAATAGDWQFTPVPGAGSARRVFGDVDWICASDERDALRCVRRQPRY